MFTIQAFYNSKYTCKKSIVYNTRDLFEILKQSA